MFYKHFWMCLLSSIFIVTVSSMRVAYVEPNNMRVASFTGAGGSGYLWPGGSCGYCICSLNSACVDDDACYDPNADPIAFGDCDGLRGLHVTYSAAKSALFWTDRNGNLVMAYTSSTTANPVAHYIDTSKSELQEVSLDDTHAFLYVVDGSALEVFRYDVSATNPTSFGTYVAQVGHEWDSIGIDSVSQTLFIYGYQSGDLRRCNQPATGSVICNTGSSTRVNLWTTTTGYFSSTIALDSRPGYRKMYFAIALSNQPSVLYVYDMDSLAQVSSTSAGFDNTQSPPASIVVFGIAVSPTEDLLYLGTTDNNVVAYTSINVTSPFTYDSLLTNAQALSIALCPDCDFTPDQPFNTDPIDAQTKALVIEIVLSVLIILVICVCGGGILCLTVSRYRAKVDREKAEAEALKMFGLLDAANIALTREISSGVTSSVWVGEFKDSGTVIAVKQPKSPQFHRTFQKEAENCGRIGQHPRIIKYLGTTFRPFTSSTAPTTQSDSVLLVYELAPVSSLETFLAVNSDNYHEQKFLLHSGLDSMTLSTYSRNTIRMLAQAADGLAFLHTKFFIHCDIAARNFLVDKDEEVYLSDFGMTCLLPSVPPRFNCFAASKRSTSVSVTLDNRPDQWCPPEMIKEIPCLATEKTDVYMFGMFMWEVLARKRPFYECESQFANPTERYAAIDNKIMSGQRPDIEGVWPKDLCELMKQCWDSDPLKRPFMSQVHNALNTMREAPYVPYQASDVKSNSRPLPPSSRAPVVRDHVPYRRTAPAAPVNPVYGYNNLSGGVLQQQPTYQVPQFQPAPYHNTSGQVSAFQPPSVQLAPFPTTQTPAVPYHNTAGQVINPASYGSGSRSYVAIG